MKEIDNATETEERIAALFRALGNPARVWIMSELAKSPHSAGELVASLPLAQSTVSEHLTVLKQAGIVRTKRGARCYCLQPEILDTIIDFCRDLKPEEPAPADNVPGRVHTPETARARVSKESAA